MGEVGRPADGAAGSPLTAARRSSTVRGRCSVADWKFARRRDRCSRCESAFEEGGRHVSALLFAADALTREDLCEACWERREPGGEIFHWYTRRQEVRRGLSLDLPTLEQLFLHLAGRDEPRVLEIRYVLCLLLLRKRRLKLVRVVRDPRETLVVRRPRREEALEIPVCDLPADRVGELQRELAAIFDGSGELPSQQEELPPRIPSADCVP